MMGSPEAVVDGTCSVVGWLVFDDMLRDQCFSDHASCN